MSTRTLTPERRHSARAPWPSTLGVSLLQPTGVGPVDHVNVSEGGLCLRLPAMLEVRSLVRLQVRPGNGLAGARPRPMECTGRVAWVTQRLDLRSMPPYLFDIGIEFVEVPKTVHRWLAHQEARPAVGRPRPAVQGRTPAPAAVQGRRFVPRIEADGAGQTRWHLVITVDDAPCFSRRYPTEREALAGWERFRRGQCRGGRASKP